MSTIRGLKSLRALSAALKRIGAQTSQRVAARVAPVLTALARAAFAQQQSPFGDAWDPGVDGAPVTLRATGKLLGTLRFAAVGSRVRAVLAVPYARYHIGKRRILPAGGIPDSWEKAIEEIFRDEVKRGLGKAA